MTPELLPCPFCGTDEFLILSNSLLGEHSFWQVECGCHAFGASEMLRENAIKAWNTRAPTVPVDVLNALEASHIALDDWLHTYAPDECGEEYVQTTRCRIFEAGGTLAYIADLQQENRRILNMIHATNNGKAE